MRPTKNQNAADSAPAVWLLKDDRPGHTNQLKGLGNRLRVLSGADVREIDVTAIQVPLWRTLLGIAPAANLPENRPILIIAAGHSTHRLLLALRRKKNSKTVVLMKPGFPLGWVDAVIAPAHDGLTSDSRSILTTEGVINTITPLARITDKLEALILIGGPSDHFEWDDDLVIEQISQLIGRYSGWRWTISGSRRTPDPLLARLEELAGPKVTLIDHHRSHQSWLSHQLAASRAVWVTPDSGSMVCEAVTSGVPTGILDLTPETGSRVARGVKRLLEQGYLAPWADHTTVMAGRMPETPQLWEADRAARWILSALLKAPCP